MKSGAQEAFFEVPKTPVPKRETDLLCEDYSAAFPGKKYVWRGVVDGAALAKLRKDNSIDEIRARWVFGLKVVDPKGWLPVSTVSQLLQKWNDLGAAMSKIDGSATKPAPLEETFECCGRTVGPEDVKFKLAQTDTFLCVGCFDVAYAEREKRRLETT